MSSTFVLAADDYFRNSQKAFGFSAGIVLFRSVSQNVLLPMITSVTICVPVEEGIMDDIFYQLKHPYTKVLISAVPIGDPELGRKNQRIPIHGELLSSMNTPRGCRFCTRCHLL